MKVIKRDGRVVEYDRNKILVAVRKANAEVEPYEKVSEDDMDGIIASIENAGRETMQVEDIQDMIDEGEDIEVKCHFCNTAYQYTIEDLKRIIKRSR